MERPRCHVFVCVNQREGGARPSCAGRGGRALVTELQRAMLRDDALADAAVTATECLGDCFSGPVAVVYPSGAWFEPADAVKLLDQVRRELAK